MKPTWTVPTTDRVRPGYKAVSSQVWTYKPRNPFRYTFHHLRPEAPGTYRFWAQVRGLDYVSEMLSFDVEVQKGPSASAGS
jgi:hypothetical protein